MTSPHAASEGAAYEVAREILTELAANAAAPTGAQQDRRRHPWREGQLTSSCRPADEELDAG